jgi:transposase-like protein
MDFPLDGLMDEPACYRWLLRLLHPDGLACPRCGARAGLTVHRRHRDPAIDYRCKGCRRVFNALTATPLHKTHRRPSRIVLILRGAAQGVSTARLARELGCSRPHLLELRHAMQARALAAADGSPLPDEVVEADEVFQNSGEKRAAARRPGRPAAAACQQGAGAGARDLGQRPAAAAGGGGAHDRPAPSAAGAADVGVGPGRLRRRADAAGGAGDDRRVGRVPGPGGGGAAAQHGVSREGRVCAR